MDIKAPKDYSFLLDYKGFIFDLDGTLLDSMPVWRSLSANYLRSRGVSPPPRLREHLRGLGIKGAAEYFRANFLPEDGVGEIMNGMHNLLIPHYFELLPPKNGAKKLLDYLHDRGFPIVLATATDRFLVEPALARTGLDKYFRAVFTTSEVGYGKRMPTIYLEAAAKLGTAIQDTMVFEDALYAIRTAKEAGFPVCAIYDAAAEKHEEIRGLADYYLTEFF